MKKSSVILYCFLLIIILTYPSLALVPEGWGKGWSEIQYLAQASYLSSTPEVLSDSGGNIYVFWLNKPDKTTNEMDQIFYLMLNDQGTVIKQPAQITQLSKWKIRNFKVLIDSGDQIHLFLELLNNAEFELRYMNYDVVNERVKMVKKVLFSERPLQGLNVKTDHEGNFYIIWAANPESNYQIFYSKYSSTVEELVAPRPLTISKELSISPNFILDSKNNLHVVWTEFDGVKWHLLYGIYTNTGSVKYGPTFVDKTVEYTNQLLPQIAGDSKDNIHISWITSTKGGYGIIDYNVYYMEMDGDTNIKIPKMKISDHGDSYKNILAINMMIDNQDTVHFVWSDTMYGPITNLYLSLKDGIITQPQMRLAVIEKSIWLPKLYIDKTQNKHLYFMEYTSGGGYNLAYMNTLKPARISYFNRLGIDIKQPLISFLYRLVSLIFYSCLGVIMNFIPLLLSILVVYFLEQWLGKIPLVLKFLFMISIVLLILPTQFAALPEIYSELYEIIVLLISFLIIIIFVSMVKLYYDELMTMVLLEVMWLFAFLFLLQVPLGHQLLG